MADFHSRKRLNGFDSVLRGDEIELSAQVLQYVVVERRDLVVEISEVAQQMNYFGYGHPLAELFVGCGQLVYEWGVEFIVVSHCFHIQRVEQVLVHPFVPARDEVLECLQVKLFITQHVAAGQSKNRS